MKNFIKGLVFTTLFISSLSLISCESNEIKPEAFADDPPVNNSPIKPPQP
jgi:hypothetical protein